MDGSGHATPFGQVADDFDQMVEDDRAWLVGELTAWAHGDPNDPGWLRTLRHGVAGYAYADFHLVTGVASGYVDVLRVGDGFQNGYQNGDVWGYIEDGLRATVLLGPIARGVGLARVGVQRAVGPQMARFIKQLQAVPNCSWITSVKALRMTGVKPFARLVDVVRKAAIPGVRTAEQTSRGYLEPLMDGLRKMGARPKQLSFHTVEDLFNFSRANPRGVVAFSVQFGTTGGATGTHSLLMSGGKIHDTYGQVFNSVREFTSKYQNAKPIVNVWGPGAGSQYFIPRAAALPPPGVLDYAGTLAGLLSSLALEVNEMQLGVRFPIGAAPPSQRRDAHRPRKGVPGQRSLEVELKADEEAVYYAMPEFNTLVGEIELRRRTGLPSVRVGQAIRGLEFKALIMSRRGTDSDVPYGWVRIR